MYHLRAVFWRETYRNERTFSIEYKRHILKRKFIRLPDFGEGFNCRLLFNDEGQRDQNHEETPRQHADAFEVLDDIGVIGLEFFNDRCAAPTGS